jgi:hypothetical protein
VNIAELLLAQRAETVIVLMMPMVRREILASHDLRLMCTALVALMHDPVVR